MCRASEWLVDVDNRAGTPLVTISSLFVVSLNTYFLLEGEAMTPTATIHPRSFLGHLYTHQPLITSAGKELLRTVPSHAWNEQTSGKMPTQAVLVSIDNGNDALKGAMLHARDPFLRTRRIVTAYAPARTIRAGEGVTTWQVNDSQPLWIGDDAVFAHKAQSLPLGMTQERFADQRFRHFLSPCLVDLVMEAGYSIHPDEMQGASDPFV